MEYDGDVIKCEKCGGIHPPSPMDQWCKPKAVGQFQREVKPPASQRVSALENQYAMMHSLCGDILATIKTNFERGTFAVLDPISKDNHERMTADFAEMLEKWEKRFEQAG